MNNVTNRMAYSEVLEILKYLPEEEGKKIPEKEIEYLKKNCDQEFQFSFDPSRSLEEQKISKKASAILVVFFKKYFANEKQKENLEEILRKNSWRAQEEAKEKYDPDRIFEKKRKNNKASMTENNQIMQYKKSIFEVLLEKIKKFFKR